MTFGVRSGPPAWESGPIVTTCRPWLRGAGNTREGAVSPSAFVLLLAAILGVVLAVAVRGWVRERLVAAERVRK